MARYKKVKFGPRGSRTLVLPDVTGQFPTQWAHRTNLGVALGLEPRIQASRPRFAVKLHILTIPLLTAINFDIEWLQFNFRLADLLFNFTIFAVNVGFEPLLDIDSIICKPITLHPRLFYLCFIFLPPCVSNVALQFDHSS